MPITCVRSSIFLIGWIDLVNASSIPPLKVLPEFTFHVDAL